jgi:hypothetical protein
MFCTNVFPNRTKSEENGGKILFSPSRILYSFHCKSEENGGKILFSPSRILYNFHCKIFTNLQKLNGIT